VNLPEIGTLQWFDGKDRSLEDSGEVRTNVSGWGWDLAVNWRRHRRPRLLAERRILFCHNAIANADPPRESALALVRH